jgi:hypothetical protein
LNDGATAQQCCQTQGGKKVAGKHHANFYRALLMLDYTINDLLMTPKQIKNGPSRVFL